MYFNCCNLLCLYKTNQQCVGACMFMPLLIFTFHFHCDVLLCTQLLPRLLMLVYCLSVCFSTTYNKECYIDTLHVVVYVWCEYVMTNKRYLVLILKVGIHCYSNATKLQTRLCIASHRRYLLHTTASLL